MENKLLPAILMSSFSFACIVLVMIGLKKALQKINWAEDKKRSFFNKAITGITVWIAFISALALTGFLSDFSSLPPRPLLVILIALSALLVIAFSRYFTQLLRVIPPQWLVYAQSFRIIVEVILWLSFTWHLLPRQMTWEGYNYDVLSGILAFPAGYLITKYPGSVKTIGIVYNVIGLLLLINVLAIAILSMPSPLRYFMNEPAVTIIGDFPFVFLPGVLVVLAMGLHIFSLRQLFLKPVVSVRERVLPVA